MDVECPVFVFFYYIVELGVVDFDDWMLAGLIGFPLIIAESLRSGSFGTTLLPFPNFIRCELKKRVFFGQYFGI